MIAVLQRVNAASVTVEGKEVSRIGEGVLVLLGVAKDDGPEDAAYLARKTGEFRIFEDQKGKMNLSLLDVGGEALAVSQFTLLADGSKGRRPSFDLAAPPENANDLYELYIKELENSGVPVKGGVFGAHMHVEIHNNGPVTFVLKSRCKNR